MDRDKPPKPPCAIELFYPSSQGTNSTDKAIELFNQEAERLEHLGKHPQIPELLAHFEQESKLYLVNDFNSGGKIMQSIQLTTHIGEDGILKIQMPSEMKDTDLEIMIIFQPVPKKEGWQPGFFEEVIGGWEGEPLVRGEQGDYEVREQLL